MYLDIIHDKYYNYLIIYLLEILFLKEMRYLCNLIEKFNNNLFINQLF